MKDKYKSYIDSIHAPEQLIEDTIKLVKKEQNSESKGRRKSFYISVISGVVAATIAIVVNINHLTKSVVYTNISEPMVRSNCEDTELNYLTMEGYEKYIGINLESLIDGNVVLDSNFNFIMSDDGVTPIYDEAVLNFSDDGKLITLKVSKTANLLPNQLIDSPKSKVGNFQVHLGINDFNRKLYAGGSINGINYFITGSGIEKKEFEKKIEKYLKNMKPF